MSISYFGWLGIKLGIRGQREAIILTNQLYMLYVSLKSAQETFTSLLSKVVMFSETSTILSSSTDFIAPVLPATKT